MIAGLIRTYGLFSCICSTIAAEIAPPWLRLMCVPSCFRAFTCLWRAPDLLLSLPSATLPRYPHLEMWAWERCRWVGGSVSDWLNE